MEGTIKYSGTNSRNIKADSQNMTRYFLDLYRAQRKQLPKDKVNQLILAAQSGDRQAYDAVLLENLPLTIKVASMYRAFEELDDLVQQGVLGLMEAIPRFRPEYGYSFATYAFHWVRQYIVRYIDCYTSTITFPIHLREKFRKYAKAIRSGEIYTKTMDRKHRYEAAKKCGLVSSLDEFDAFESYYVSSSLWSLDDVVSNSDGEEICTLVDAIASADDVEAQVINSLLKEEIHAILCDLLNGRDLDIIKMRMGFECEPMTLQEVGDIYGLSRERIRQIEKTSLAKIRNRLFILYHKDAEPIFSFYFQDVA